MNRLRVLLVCAALEFAALSGMPMRADEVQDLMRQMNGQKLAHALPANRDGGDNPRDSWTSCDAGVASGAFLVALTPAGVGCNIGLIKSYLI